MKRRPHILIFQTDQLAAQALGLYGGFAKTPNLESLARGGVVFENTYCNYPLCAPSRFSMLTGQLATSIGAFDNAAQLPVDLPTFAHHLRRADYRTCLSGKMHFIGPDQLHGFEERLTTDIYPADFAWLPNWESGNQAFAPIRNTIERGGVCAWNMQLAYDEDVTFQAVRKIYDFARKPSQPFCLMVSLTHPHHPFLTTPSYWERYDHAAVPEPRVGRLPDEALDPHSRRCRRVIGLSESDVTTEDARAARHAYYGSISYIDDKIAAVLAALETAGMTEDTAIFVISDHGEMLGERGLWAKDCFFEWAMRIPLLVNLPGLSGGRRISNNVSLIDLLPTLLDLAEIDSAELSEPPAGQSLMGLLTGTADAWPDRVLAEYTAEAAEAPMVMIRQGAYKYIHSEDDPPLLYDLATDPDELQNLAKDPEQEVRCKDFAREVAACWDLATLDSTIRLSQRRRALVGDAMARGDRDHWDYEPQPDYSRIYVRTASGSELADRQIRVPAKGYELPGTSEGGGKGER